MPLNETSTTDDRAAEPRRQSRAPRVHVDERGEGVISTAIAVLIVAFLGAAMWLSFQAMFATATDNTRTQVEQIGR